MAVSLFSFAAAAEEKTTQGNWQAMEMENNTAYISTTHNMLEEDNIAYYGQTRTQIPTEDCVAYDRIGGQITTEDNTAYDSIHIQVPIATDDDPAYVITGNNSTTSDQNADCQGQYDYVPLHIFQHRRNY